MTARHALLAAATVVVLLALGPFASPLVSQEVGAVTTESPIDHRNQIPVVQPGRSITGAAVSARLPRTRSLLLVTIAASLLVAAPSFRRRRREQVHEPSAWPGWVRPPRRGPPLLTAG